MIELKTNELVFRFPKVHKNAICRVSFQRTLLIPDDNRDYPLPPGLGRFPIEPVKEHMCSLIVRTSFWKSSAISFWVNRVYPS